MRDLTDHSRSIDTLVQLRNLRRRDGLLSGPIPMLDTSGKPDLERHVRRLARPQPGGERELGELVSRLRANPLDLRQPMWDRHVIDRLEGNRFALFSKIHHVFIDGVAGMRMFQRAMSATADEIRPGPWAYADPSRSKRKSPSAKAAAQDSSVAARRGLVLKSVGNLYPMLVLRARRVKHLVTAFSAPGTVLNGRITAQPICLPRLERVHASIRALKDQVSALPPTTVAAFSPAVMGPYALQQAMGPAGRTRPMFNVVVSNVPGPPQSLYMFGARLDAMCPPRYCTVGRGTSPACVTVTIRISASPPGATPCPMCIASRVLRGSPRRLGARAGPSCRLRAQVFYSACRPARGKPFVEIKHV